MACASISTRRLRPTPTACATSNTRSGWPRTATLGDLDRERIADIDLRLSLELDGPPWPRTPRTGSALSLGGDGGGDRRHRHATARQQDLPSDDSGRLLRRSPTVRGRHALPLGETARRLPSAFAERIQPRGRRNGENGLFVTFRPLIRDTWNTDIVPELAPEDGGIALYKHRYSGFFETELDETLRSWGFRNLVFTGCTTSVCVESTIKDAMFATITAWTRKPLPT